MLTPHGPHLATNTVLPCELLGNTQLALVSVTPTWHQIDQEPTLLLAVGPWKSPFASPWLSRQSRVASLLHCLKGEVKNDTIFLLMAIPSSLFSEYLLSGTPRR